MAVFSLIASGIDIWMECIFRFKQSGLFLYIFKVENTSIGGFFLPGANVFIHGYSTIGIYRVLENVNSILLPNSLTPTLLHWLCIPVAICVCIYGNVQLCIFRADATLSVRQQGTTRRKKLYGPRYRMAFEKETYSVEFRYLTVF